MWMMLSRCFHRLAAPLFLLSTLALAADQPPKLRLSEVQDISPLGYRADLKLDPAADEFSGSIIIEMEIKQATPVIWLNQEHLTIQSATLESGGKSFKASTIPGGDDFIGFRFSQPVPPSKAQLSIVYTGKVDTKNSEGLFRQQDNGNWYLFSQFEPTDARAAFPCFDEPAFKTPWQLTLRVPAEDTAVSNTGVVSDTVEGKNRTVVFRQTLPLPSYLVALGVGPFEFVDAGKAGKNQVPVRIVVPRGHTREAKFAAQVTAEIITRHEAYFGVPYPYDKADQLAIPNTVGWGAMENPGLVTYAHSILLADPDHDTISRQRGYVIDAAHELAHQWFGDLVTTAWWDDIWLNEAFATWMEQKYAAEYYPQWNSRVGDVATKLGAADEDSLITARQIRQPILTKDDINNAFDDITYEKGASVIGMFENWMGAENFRKGVHAYLETYAFKATNAGEFLDSISSATKKDVTKAFTTFLNQAGIPMLSVSLKCGQGAPSLHIEQQRYLPVGSKGSADQVWQVPVCVRYPSGDSTKTECHLTIEKTSDWALTTQGCPAWIQADDRAVGYYRVDYQGDLLAKLTQGNVADRLPPAERLDLIGNVQALANGGKLPETAALHLVEKLHDDPVRQVVERTLNLSVGLRFDLVPSPLIPNYQRFLQKMFLPQALALGWTPKPGESDDARLLRASLLETLATDGGDRDLAKQAQDLTEKWLDNHTALDPSITDAVLSTAAFYGDEALFHHFLVEFKKASDKHLKDELVRAMSSFRDPKAIASGMNALLNGEIPFIEGTFLLFGGEEEEATRTMPLEFLKAHFDEVVAKMPSGGGFDFGAVLPQVGDSFCDAKSKAELKEFFEPRVGKFVGAPRTLDQVLEEIDLCIARKQAKQPDVIAFLKNY
jgi:cytosol alanyl aminopeptidase